MKSGIAMSSLLFALVTGLAGVACAGDAPPTMLAPDRCSAIRLDIAAMAAHLHETRAYRADEGTAAAGYQTLARELGAHIEALQANLPAPGTQRAQASVLLSDMRDALSLMRNAERVDAREVAAQRIEQDGRLYDSVVTTLGCTDARPTPL